MTRSKCRNREMPAIDPHILPGVGIPSLPGERRDAVRQRDSREAPIIELGRERCWRELAAEAPVAVQREDALRGSAGAGRIGEYRRGAGQRGSSRAAAQEVSAGNVAGNGVAPFWGEGAAGARLLKRFLPIRQHNREKTPPSRERFFCIRAEAAIRRAECSISLKLRNLSPGLMGAAGRA